MAPEEEDTLFDRPTVIPSVPPEEIALEATIGDSAVLRRAGRVPSLDELGLPPPRSQMPTLASEDPLAFDISLSIPPAPDSNVRAVSAEDDLSLDIDHLRAPGWAPGTSPLGPRKVPGRLMEDEEEPAPISSEFEEGSALNLAGRRPAQPAPAPAPAPVASPAPPQVARSRTANPGTPEMDMRDRFALGDFSGALVVAESLLDGDPSNAEAARYAETCRERLRQMYAARLGALDKVPRVIVPPDQVRWLSLDHRAGFVLSCVDGYSNIEEILDVSGMPSLDALRVLYELLQQRIISVG